MAASLQGIPKGSLVHRFITAGRPGRCELCDIFVEKLEAHHISYKPETTIKLCHLCHHKTHFWPNRLNQKERLELLSRKFNPALARRMLKEKTLGVQAMAKLIAPSRREHIHKEQIKEIKRISRKKRKV